jgi:D-beta-D-heptose 7-phosphate kinase/D-beta-D-heptose 1-phosphate adenosyltransferase
VFDNYQLLLETVHQHFLRRRILVIGDLILDRYLRGDVSRISPESPVPVVHLTHENEVGGGCANVAVNLATLGLSVAIVGYVGEDAFGDRLLNILQNHAVSTAGIIRRPDIVTVVKTRVIGGRQQMLRIDREDSYTAAEPPTEAEMLGAIENFLHEGVDGVILSDYAKGVLSENICRQVISSCRHRRIPIFVDPKGQDFSKYTGATAISPNRRELAAACRTAPHPLEPLLQAGQSLTNKLQLEFLAVTLGEHGIALLDGHTISNIPAVAREVFDVSGAGDTVIAALSASIIAGLNTTEALHLANLAAGIVVGKVGTAAVTREELLHALSTEQTVVQSEKICTLPDLLARVEQWRAKGDRIVFTNGCFDLLHVGHVTYLAAARKLGNRLLVGLNSDRSVRALKGPGRPVVNEEDRARVLAALTAVDAVVLFDQETPLELIKSIRPDVLAKGNDYTFDQVVGAKEVTAWNGEVVLVPLVDGKSSSDILRTIRSAAKAE